ncbi:hydroxyacylglutathione hydrolase [Thorsellia kenyensis]|uniref:Hydroxyacylglutathione hydrolase n=1 Tax=Thorsellia kenyensis TaxID=1549888 RepID=A0ABV6CH86_9GAMM
MAHKNIKTVTHNSLLLTCLPVLEDNYIWLLTETNLPNHPTYVIDPGESNSVLNYIKEQDYQLVGILLTHHHYDHTDGICDLMTQFPDIPVYGPRETLNKGATHVVEDNQVLSLFDLPCKVIETPGHTLGHVCYYFDPFLFSGDTLFSAGCGKLFEGTCEQMFESFIRLYQLPDETLVCAAHEYTLKNLQFSASIDKSNEHIEFTIKNVEMLYSANLPSLPVQLGTEKLINPYFLIIKKHMQGPNLPEIDVKNARESFCLIRKLRDNF